MKLVIFHDKSQRPMTVSQDTDFSTEQLQSIEKAFGAVAGYRCGCEVEEVTRRSSLGVRTTLSPHTSAWSMYTTGTSYLTCSVSL